MTSYSKLRGSFNDYICQVPDNFIIGNLMPVFCPYEELCKRRGNNKRFERQVSYREKDNIPFRAAKKGTIIEVGYRVKTGADGWAALTLSDGSKLTIANNTEIRITKFMVENRKKEGIFDVLQGKLRASVVHLSGENVDYKVQSPTAVAGIKGTEFMMLTEGRANVFFGNEGVADISGGANGTKRLSPDTMVQNTRGYTPVDPVRVEPDSPLNAAKKNFLEITGARPPADWEISDNLPHIIARWDINYGHYLADAGKYDEALYVFQIAIDLSTSPDIRSDARLERGAVYARSLGNQKAALSEYLSVMEEYPKSPQRETALYLAGMTLYGMGSKSEAKEKLVQYMKDYPNGKFTGNVETILNILDK